MPNKPKTREEMDELINWINRTIRGWETSEVSHTKKLSNPNIAKAIQKDVQYLRQIRQLIQNQPEVPEEQYIEIVMDLYDRIEKLEKKQFKITMKDIEGWADEIRERVTNHEDWGYAADTIKDMVEEEFGIKVKK